jgi:hypothetical protein
VREERKKLSRSKTLSEKKKVVVTSRNYKTLEAIKNSLVFKIKM